MIAKKSRFRAGLTLAMALLVFGLSVFAVIGGLHKKTIFAAISCGAGCGFRCCC